MNAKKRILVADDEPQFLEMIKIRLEASGYEVKAALNGKDAVDEIKRDKPDAVLMDILMPEMDGLQALKAVRKMDKNLPVFIISAFSDEEKFEKARELGASGFIVKTGSLKSELEQVFAALRIADKYKKI